MSTLSVVVNAYKTPFQRRRRTAMASDMDMSGATKCETRLVMPHETMGGRQ